MEKEEEFIQAGILLLKEAGEELKLKLKMYNVPCRPYVPVSGADRVALTEVRVRAQWPNGHTEVQTFFDLSGLDDAHALMLLMEYLNQ